MGWKSKPVRRDQVDRIIKSKVDTCHAFENGNRQQIERALAVATRAWANSTPDERKASGKKRKKR